MRPRRLVITSGDPAGVGPEVTVRALAHPEVRDAAQYVVLGNRRVFETTMDALDVYVPFRYAREENAEFGPEPLLLETDRMRDAPVEPGEWTQRTGRASLSYILKAVEICSSGDGDAMVTGPVCKEALRSAGCTYPGHTDLLADLLGAEKVVMMLAGGGLRVALVTTHVALAAVPQVASRGEVYGTLAVTHRALRESFGIEQPRIAVLGLNPHCGEGGMFGSEETRHIEPAIRAAARDGFPSTGPIPADTAFHRMLQGEFDCIVAMYHDQGLGPLKTVAFDDGVNITLGLPVVRTSVDHGTAFDIAARRTASETSMVAAVETAIRMARSRAVGPRP